ncbi:MAG: hypothetical protein BMS9Abin05_0752 [Rhodothermia bacterium]|nr:MAG: hypothetical protein BMS9Abin05_0752 [Rhodothermia bacterium]
MERQKVQTGIAERLETSPHPAHVVGNINVVASVLSDYFFRSPDRWAALSDWMRIPQNDVWNDNM